MKRATLAAVLAVGWILVLATPASAHTVSGVGATNWKSVLTSVSPTVPGLSVRLVEGGSRLEVTNHGPEILVLGYDGEPYLRVGPEGVFENLKFARHLPQLQSGRVHLPRRDQQGRPTTVEEDLLGADGPLA